MIISVTGAHSGVGKTTVCAMLLKEFKGFGAIKFTKTDLYTSVVDDIKTLRQPGKDTAIMLEAGAERVVWIQSPYDALRDALDLALSKLSDINDIIVEGNSPVDFLGPDLVIFILDKGEVKPSALKAAKRADVVIINSKTKEEVIPKVRKDTTVFWIDLKERRGEIEEFLKFIKERVKRVY
ncbi:MAG: hypothetical protein HY756_05570 [Nitrospirae bacterium]|nr:hypothetical protein [Nitrospirota bacterium]